MKKPILASVLTLVLIAACNGNVVVDGPGTGALSTGGSTGTTLSTGGTTTLPTGSGCFDLPPTTSLGLCGGGSSGGPAQECSFFYCSQTSSDMWEADCTSNTCQCLLNGIFQCSCALVTQGDFCGGTPDCCVHPSE